MGNDPTGRIDPDGGADIGCPGASGGFSLSSLTGNLGAAAYSAFSNMHGCHDCIVNAFQKAIDSWTNKKVDSYVNYLEGYQGEVPVNEVGVEVTGVDHLPSDGFWDYAKYEKNRHSFTWDSEGNPVYFHMNGMDFPIYEAHFNNSNVKGANMIYKISIKNQLQDSFRTGYNLPALEFKGRNDRLIGYLVFEKDVFDDLLAARQALILSKLKSVYKDKPEYIEYINNNPHMFR